MGLWFEVVVVMVENEFHLPSTTVTRVITGKFVKTVVTRALPQENGSTKLFWDGGSRRGGGLPARGRVQLHATGAPYAKSRANASTKVTCPEAARKNK
jgi:hypothetical protein